MGRNQYWAGRFYDLCVYYMTGTPEGSTESGFMDCIKKKLFVAFPWVETIYNVYLVLTLWYGVSHF